MRVVFSWVCLSVCQVAAGAMWYVDSSVPASGNGQSWEAAFRTIQEGIDSASDGDTVTVAQGIYLENVHFKGKNIVLRSTNPLDPNVVAGTIIDGSQSGSVVTFAGTESRACRLEGFTLRNGYAGNGGGICGGKQDERTSATIRNSVIAGNSSGMYGGGLAWCGGKVQNNTITGNTATYHGGGLWSCSGTIQKNIIAENSAGENGGGLHDCDGTIRWNTIARNSAGWYGGGLAWCDGVIANNVIVANSSDYRGAGMWGCMAAIENNAIVGNSAAGDGGGLYDCDWTILNNTIVGNTADGYGGGLSSCDGEIRDCIIWGNEAANNPQIDESSEPSYSCIQNWADGEGNVADDPLFVDPDGLDDDPLTYEDNDYRLSADSPCVDGGKNEGWMEHAVDLDGKLRISYGRGSLTVDMGAYEHGPWTFGVFDIVAEAGAEVEITWRSRPDDTYVIWSCLDPLNALWTEEATIPTRGRISSWVDTNIASRCKAYIIEMR
jgi:hypothetical protein